MRSYLHTLNHCEVSGKVKLFFLLLPFQCCFTVFFFCVCLLMVL